MGGWGNQNLTPTPFHVYGVAPITLLDWIRRTMSDVVATLIENNVMEATRSPVDIFKLPAGYVDSTGVLHNEVEINEMTGKVEDILANKQISEHRRLDGVLAGCIKRIGTIDNPRQIQQVVANLPIPDRNFLLYAIRRRTHGDDYPTQEECFRCGAVHIYTPSLRDLEVRPMPNPQERERTVVLPSKKVAKIKILTGADEVRRAELEKDKRAASMSGNSKRVYQTLVSLNDVPPTLEDIGNLSLSDRDAIVAASMSMEAVMEMHLPVACQGCGELFDVAVVPGAMQFFYPLAYREGLKRRSST